MALTVRSCPDFKSGAASPIFRIPGLSYRGATRRYSPLYGEQWVLVFESVGWTDQTSASAAETGYYSCPAEFGRELQTGGPVHRLTVTTPDEPTAGQNVISSDYQLLGNALQMDIREHPVSLNLGAATISLIDEKLASDTPSEINLPAGNATYLYNLLRQRKGNMAYQKPQFVFRASYVVGRRGTIPIAYANTERIYTTDQMIAEAGPPPSILAGINRAVTATTPGAISDNNDGGYSFGWLKQTPVLQTIAGNKSQLTQEWWLENWSLYCYALKAA